MAKSIKVDENKVQKPAILVNNPGEELIDPLEKICIQLNDVSRLITRHYLAPMQKQLDLDNPKPTLAQRTRFNRLNKLNSILIELTQQTRNINKWRTKNTNFSNDVKKIIDRAIQNLGQVTTQLNKTWMSLTVKLDSLNFLSSSESMERKMIEYHVCLEDFIDALIKMILRLKKTKLENLPIDPDYLANIELSFPMKVTDHEKIAKEMHETKESIQEKENI